MARRFKTKSKTKKHVEKNEKRICKHKLHKRALKVNSAKQYIRNLSKVTLNQTDITALGKGLKFIPIPHIKLSEIFNDFRNTERCMRLKVLFSNTEDTHENTLQHPFRTKSNWRPLTSDSNNLENYLYATKIELAKFSMKKRFNISKSEMIALHRLKKNSDLVIRKADKGSTIVILNKNDYVEEGLRQLNDGIHYEKIDSIDICGTLKNVRNHAAHMHYHNEIDKVTFGYLYDVSMKPNTPYIYFLPKIHKVAHLLSMLDTAEAVRETTVKMPGRPIISQCGAPTERIGRFLDYFLKPIVRKQPTFIRDTKQFIQKIEAMHIPKSALLITYDVTSLYTNFRFNELLLALRMVLNENDDIQYEIVRPSTTSLVKIAEILLTNNEFTFDGQSYKQIVGAPQGAVPSPEICDIAIYQHINSILQSFEYTDQIMLHTRFRDDGFIIFNGTKQHALRLFEIANESHDLLKFTFEISEENAIFLDTEISKCYTNAGRCTLDIKCHSKPTDTFQYLQRNSCHPGSVFKSFITGEMHRRLRNTNNIDMYNKQLKAFKLRLINRGYSAEEISMCYRKLKFNDRKNVVYRMKHKTCMNKLMFVTKYHPDAKYLNSVFKKHWQLIENDAVLSKLFPQGIMTAFRKGKNIADLITRNKL